LRSRANDFTDPIQLVVGEGLPSRELTYPPDTAYLKMIFLFPRWDMLVPWRVYNQLKDYCLSQLRGSLDELVEMAKRALTWVLTPDTWWQVSPFFRLTGIMPFLSIFLRQFFHIIAYTATRNGMLDRIWLGSCMNHRMASNWCFLVVAFGILLGILKNSIPKSKHVLV